MEKYVPKAASKMPVKYMAISAHKDDIEMMAFDGIVKGQSDGGFVGVVLTDGGACPRAEQYAGVNDCDMAELRSAEQKRASEVGKFAALYLFEKSSAEVKEKQEEIILGLKEILEEYQGLDALYIHSIFDSHKTHVAASFCAIEAVRLLENSKKPKKIYGCELWRDLDWLPNDEKVVFDVSGNDELSRNLMDCFASQNAVKRYDLASIARRVSNATYYASHSGDTANELIYAVDLTELGFEGVSIASFAQAKLKKFGREVLNNF